MKRTLITIILTVIVVFGLIVYCIKDNIKIESYSQGHHRTVIEDGEVVSERDWKELIGYSITVDLRDQYWLTK